MLAKLLNWLYLYSQIEQLWWSFVMRASVLVVCFVCSSAVCARMNQASLSLPVYPWAAESSGIMNYAWLSLLYLSTELLARKHWHRRYEPVGNVAELKIMWRATWKMMRNIVRCAKLWAGWLSLATLGQVKITRRYVERILFKSMAQQNAFTVGCGSFGRSATNVNGIDKLNA